MKRHILPLFLALSLLLSLMTVTALAVPEVTGNVGDDNGVVTTAGNGTTATSPVTLPTTAAPATTVPTTTATAPTTTAPTTLPTTTAPTTTGAGDTADDGGNTGRVIGIILAVLIAAAIVVLVVLLLPRMRDKKGGR